MKVRNNEMVELPIEFYSNPHFFHDIPHQIVPGLFLGPLTSSLSERVLKHKQIKHIVRVLDVEETTFDWINYKFGNFPSKSCV